MIPSQVYQTVTDQFNDASGKFASAAEVYNYIWMAETELNLRLHCYEKSYAGGVTIAGTQEYGKPTGCISLERVIYDTTRLKKLDFRSIELADGSGYGTTSSGTPQFYYEYGEVIGLYPTPSAVATIRFYFIGTPAQLWVDGTLTNAFSVPDQFTNYFADYALWRIFAKDQDEKRANFYQAKWEASLARALAEWTARKYRDRIMYVKDQDSGNESDFGMA